MMSALVFKFAGPFPLFRSSGSFLPVSRESRMIKGNRGKRLAESDSSVLMWYKNPMRQEQLQAQIEKVKAELLKLGPMRPGSLSQQYSACQKPGCKCVDPVHPQKHGPFYQLSYTYLGKSTTQFVRPQFVTEVRKQLAAYKKFTAITQQWVTLALELCKLEMQEARSAASRSERTPRA